MPKPEKPLVPERITYSPAEVADLTGLSIRSVRYLLGTGRLAYVRIGRRVLIRASDLDALLRRHVVRARAGLDATAPIRPAAEKNHGE